MRYRQSNGIEISGFIDFEESLRESITSGEKATDWTAIFNETKKLRPKKTDLGYDRLTTNEISTNPRSLVDITTGIPDSQS